MLHQNLQIQVTSGSSPKESQWVLYKFMSFMEKHISTRKRASNITSSKVNIKKQCMGNESPQTLNSQSSAGDNDNPWSSISQIIPEEESEVEEVRPERETQEEPQPGPSHAGNTPHRQKSVAQPRKQRLDVQGQVQETLSALTNYLRVDKVRDRNAAFGEYVGLSLSEMPAEEQNYKRLKIVNILNELFTE
ncbi:hypothetical protein FQR65_LT08715 [Abscondita terminalis]|nr:hypothetical protein FQR65_LT08715 [Abscondita terminalis]